MTRFNVSHLGAVSAVVFSLSAGGAYAAEPDNWYATTSIGFGSLASSTLTYSDGAQSVTGPGEFSSGAALGGTLGYRFGNGLSVEGEIMYRRNDLDPVDLGGLGSFTGGDFASLAFGVNALYRFSLGESGQWSGYVGPGLVYFQEIDIDFEAGGQQEVSFESDDSAFQLKLGGRYDFGEDWFAEAGATYLPGDSIKMELPARPNETIESDYDNWSLSIGIGRRF